MNKEIKKNNSIPSENTLFRKTLRNSSLAFSSLILSTMILLGCIYFYLAWRLPDVAQLKDIHLQVPLRIYTSDGKLLGEFGEKKRLPVPINQVPKQLIQAILDTEDQRFFEHPGVDFIGLLRATKAVLESGRKSQGASTITMQVARNFFFNPEKTYTRKLNEMMLALKIDQNFSKQEILELYLNKIYLGQRAYGVATAAQVYYGKSLNDLTLAEIAMLAGLPQAPSRDNPIVNPEAAIERRNHVLTRMHEAGHIDTASYKKAIAAPNTASYHENIADVQGQYVAEMVRQAMVDQFGADVYDRGYSVYTTIDSHLQTIAHQAVRDGVMAYDRRHGYRGVENNLGTPSSSKLPNWRRTLRSIPIINNIFPAAVIAVDTSGVNILFSNGVTQKLPWNRATLNLDSSNSEKSVNIRVGDIIRVEKINEEWHLSQVPEVEAAFVAMNPQNGGILALTGGFAYNKSNFNRATQADRQTGSAFKPFIYSAALAKGFSLASVINDAPVVIADTATTIWRPQNDSGVFHGPTRLRAALAVSTNLVSIRLLQSIGLPYTIDYLQRFGFTKNQLAPGLSMALGATSISPVQLISGYATFANGGYKITPYFINQIKDQDGKIIFEAKPKVAPPFHEQANFAEIGKSSQNPKIATRTIDSQNAYIITDALKDVIRAGTASKALSLKRSDLAGKTGTTNNYNDAWFCGFNGDIVAGAWVGFDKQQSVGEHGNQAALPIWIDFMKEALQGKPENSMPKPEGIINMRIDPKTGLRASPDQPAIFEIFAEGTAPSKTAFPRTISANVNPETAISENKSSTEDVDIFTESTTENAQKNNNNRTISDTSIPKNNAQPDNQISEPYNDSKLQAQQEADRLDAELNNESQERKQNISSTKLEHTSKPAPNFTPLETNTVPAKENDTPLF